METVVRVENTERFVDVSDGGTGWKRAVAWSATDVPTTDGATQIGAAAAATFGVRDSVKVTAEDYPVWLSLGDGHSTFTWSGSTGLQRASARTVEIGDGAVARVSPTFQSPDEQSDARILLAVKRIATGLAGGRSAGVSVSVPRELSTGVPSGALQPVSVPPWSQSWVDVKEGPLWRAEDATVVTKTEVLCTGAGPPDDDVSVNVKVNGVTAVTVTLPQLATSFSILGSLVLAAGFVLQVETASIGANDPADMTDLNLTVQFTAAPAALRVDS